MSDRLINRFVLLLVILILPFHASAQHKAYHGDGIDNILEFVPVVSAYTLKACGVESASSWKRLVVNTAASYAISMGVAYTLKHAIHKTRPDGTDNQSFPSGHATRAFAGATILAHEYGKRSPWIAVAGYGVAALTAADRIRRNRHDATDVLTGAAIGVAATELGYFLGDKITGEKSRYNVSFTGNAMALRICL